MKELLLLAAQHAGVADVFHELVPKWAFAALFARIVGSEDCDHVAMSTTLLQDWLIEERMKVPSKAVLDLFLRSSNSETMSKAEFAQVWTCARSLPCRRPHQTRRRLGLASCWTF